jgi:uncharacterized repeat protein (TIGR03803 family)
MKTSERLPKAFPPAFKWTMYLIIAICIFASGARGASKEKVIYSFTDQSDGADPTSPLTLDMDGNLYGEASGGRGLYGVVFQLTPSLTGSWRETTLHSFYGGSNGAYPTGGVILGAPGKFFGVTAGGGAYSEGTVFELTRPSALQVIVLYNFQEESNQGTSPNSLIRDQAGNLYGTTLNGGINGLGTVFELSPGYDGSWTYQEIFTFTYGGNYAQYGAYPYGALTMDRAGNLYGTTFEGGEYGNGTVFELTNTSEGWKESLLYNFTGGDNGAGPLAGVIFDTQGNLFGTTSSGGQDEVGTVFQLTPTRGGWVHQVLYNFTGGLDGGSPYYGSLAMDAAGNLFGTTKNGGDAQLGTVFKLVRGRGSHNWRETVLHSFTGAPDGVNPVFGLVLDPGGNLYGTTPTGGSDDFGIVFEITL